MRRNVIIAPQKNYNINALFFTLDLNGFISIVCLLPQSYQKHLPYTANG
jgi:hypothetical protein